MKRLHFIVVCCVALRSAGAGQSVHPALWPDSLPVYDHIVIVVEENKDYREVVGSASAPYINGVLRAEGANLTRMFAEEHNSEGNYFWMFSGSNQSVGFRDAIPDEKNNKNYPFRSGNLGEALIQRGLTFRGYAEDLPEVGSTVTHAGHYARKHVPWISFADLPNGTSADSSVNLQFAQFPSDFSTLPTVSFVIPNLINDMHDPATQLKVSVKNADDWLKRNIDAYYQWARTHNSLLIVTFDENDDRSGYVGLTDPKSRNRDRRNRIPTIITGARIRHGDYPEGKGVTHVNLLRTLEAMYGLPKSGSQQRFAAKFGIADNVIITDIFTGQK